MSPRTKPPAVVAELGRPETPEETAARKAQDSSNHRTRQTLNNLVYSLLATLALVAIIVLVVPRGNPTATQPSVDYTSIAQQAKGTEPDPLLVPKLPSSWKSNNAELRTKTADKVDSWYIGLITPKQQFIGMTQGFAANDSWTADQVDKSMIKGTRTIDGVTWDVYDNRTSGSGNGNVEYALVNQTGASTIILFGTADDTEFRTVATSLAPQIRSLPGGP